MKNKVMSYTPGPWQVTNITNTGKAMVICPVYKIADVSSLEDAYLIAASPDLLEAAEGIAIRFGLEHQTTTKKCRCLQFEDNAYCRHIALLMAIAKAKGGKR